MNLHFGFAKKCRTIVTPKKILFHIAFFYIYGSKAKFNHTFTMAQGIRPWRCKFTQPVTKANAPMA
jgi:hypothetical protein